MIPTEADSLTERSGKETVKESTAKTLSSQGNLCTLKAIISKEQVQGLHTAGATDFTKIVKSLNK